MNGSVKCKSDSLNSFIVKEILKIFYVPLSIYRVTGIIRAFTKKDSYSF